MACRGGVPWAGGEQAGRLRSQLSVNDEGARCSGAIVPLLAGREHRLTLLRGSNGCLGVGRILSIEGSAHLLETQACGAREDASP